VLLFIDLLFKDLKFKIPYQPEKPNPWILNCKGNHHFCFGKQKKQELAIFCLLTMLANLSN